MDRRWTAVPYLLYELIHSMCRSNYRQSALLLNGGVRVRAPELPLQKIVVCRDAFDHYATATRYVDTLVRSIFTLGLGQHVPTANSAQVSSH